MSYNLLWEAVCGFFNFLAFLSTGDCCRRLGYGCVWVCSHFSGRWGLQPCLSSSSHNFFRQMHCRLSIAACGAESPTSSVIKTVKYTLTSDNHLLGFFSQTFWRTSLPRSFTSVLNVGCWPCGLRLPTLPALKYWPGRALDSVLLPAFAICLLFTYSTQCLKSHAGHFFFVGLDVFDMGGPQLLK